jgi:RNA polymerase sigma-70 factor (ECF subfamily)
LAAITEQSSLSILGAPKSAGSPRADAVPSDAVSSHAVSSDAEPGNAVPQLSRTPAASAHDFADIYERQFDFVWRSLRLLGVAPEIVEDATQDVFSVASRQLARFEGRSSIRTWLFAILQRVAANHRRTARRKLNRLEPLVDGVLSLDPTQQERAEAAQALDVVQRFCSTLDLDRRALFVLVMVEELPASEVSQVLGIPVNTVYSRVRGLREGLRRALEEHEARHG